MNEYQKDALYLVKFQSNADGRIDAYVLYYHSNLDGYFILRNHAGVFYAFETKFTELKPAVM